jgi:two-component system cell cycle sensor histidine kinase/response regulator CckA
MPPKTGPNPPPTVLIVDDEEPVRLVARRILEGEGYRVIEASNGLDAITLLDCGTAIDLLMADLDMPEIKGEEMVQRIRATRPDLPVLYVTGNIRRLLTERLKLRAREALWPGTA